MFIHLPVLRISIIEDVYRDQLHKSYVWTCMHTNLTVIRIIKYCKIFLYYQYLPTIVNAAQHEQIPLAHKQKEKSGHSTLLGNDNLSCYLRGKHFHHLNPPYTYRVCLGIQQSTTSNFHRIQLQSSCFQDTRGEIAKAFPWSLNGDNYEGRCSGFQVELCQHGGLDPK